MSAAGLPKQLGGEAQPNARQITLSYGQTESVLTLVPGGGDLSALRAAADKGPAAVLLELADQVKGMTSG
jgi:hypothetical protein